MDDSERSEESSSSFEFTPSLFLASVEQTVPPRTVVRDRNPLKSEHTRGTPSRTEGAAPTLDAITPAPR